jgi:(p)ppGpp synthase/HD superfamily hydrolase
VPQFPSFVDTLPVTRSALEFAAAHHQGQRRASDDAAFILHPLEVAQP